MQVTTSYFDENVERVRVKSVTVRRFLRRQGGSVLTSFETDSGSRPGDTDVTGSGQVRVDSIDLGVPRGRALKVLRRTGRGGLGCEQAYWIP